MWSLQDKSGGNMADVKLTGFSHLLAGVPPDAGGEGDFLTIAVSSLVPGKYQPRTEFKGETLQELANSIAENGIIQPLLIRPLDDHQYEIIAGERRWRAAKLAGLTEVPAVVRDIPNDTALVFALIENVQRDDLNLMDRVSALCRLKDEFKMPHSEIAKVVGLSRPSVTNLMRLQALPEKVKALLQNGELGIGHARPLLSLRGERQLKAAEEMVHRKLSAREAERLIQKIQASAVVKPSPASIDREKVQNWSKHLSTQLSSPVQVSLTPAGRGKVVINFDSEDKLEWLITRLTAPG